MLKFSRWEIRLIVSLLAASLLIYVIHYLVFHDLHHILIFGVHELAFLPLEVLFVTLIIERVISGYEKRERQSKLKILLGASFSEFGIGMLKMLSGSMKPEFRRQFSSASIQQLVSASKSEVERYISSIRFPEKLVFDAETIAALKDFLSTRREFMVRLLENPAVLEDESFTSLLFAAFHLSDELSYRDNIGELPESDIEHLSGDITRAFRLLAVEWLKYMVYLSHKYPYLYSLYLRTNPFEETSDAIVKK